MFLSDEGLLSTLETLDFTIYIGSTPTFLYFDMYFNTACTTLHFMFLSDEKCLEGLKKTFVHTLANFYKLLLPMTAKH